MKAAFYTLGCKLNQAETESIAASFRTAGFDTGTLEEDASIYVINTCTVTTKGEQKARRIIRKILKERPLSSVIVTGCYAQLDPEELKSLGDRVAVIPLDRKDILLDLPDLLFDSTYHGNGVSLGSGLKDSITLLENSRAVSVEDRFRFQAVPDGFHTRPTLKIQDGCNNRCSYCRVSIARGPSVSLDPSEVVRRVRFLEEAGSREVVLTGVNISSYSAGGLFLHGLLTRIISETASIRIRLSSLEPDAIDENFARVLSHPRICPHFHLPVQSGSDSILSSMKRRYSASRMREAATLLRSVKSDPFLAADVIVGFPGESQEAYLETFKLLSELDFSWLHVFPFSPRPGTPAAHMPGFIPEHVATLRASQLQELSRHHHGEYKNRQLGRIVNLLLESTYIYDGIEYWQGMTENYLKTCICVHSIPGALKGDVIACRIEGFLGETLYASPLT